MAESPAKKESPIIQLVSSPQIGRGNAATPISGLDRRPTRGSAATEAGPSGGPAISLVRATAPKSPVPTPPSASHATPLNTVARDDASSARRVVGLLLILATAYLASIPEGAWHDWMVWVNQNVFAPARGVNGAPGKALPIDRVAPEGASPTAAADAGSLEKQWFRWLLVFACATGVLLLHRAKPINFLPQVCVTAALMAGGAYCAGVLLHTPPPWRLLLCGAVGLGYLIQTARRSPSLSGVGVLGLALVVLACLGASQGWFGGVWTYVAAKTGPGPVKFVAAWGEELAWGLVVFLAMLGTLWSRTRPVHFLIAVLLVALAIHCVDSGRVAYRTFAKTPAGEFVKLSFDAEQLAEDATGSKILRLEDESFANVRPWRWVAAVEMSVVAAILLYKALGVGSLNVAFALTWMFLGCYFYDSLRSASFLGSLLRATPGAMAGLSPEANNGNKAAVGGPLDVGLPSGSASQKDVAQPPSAVADAVGVDRRPTRGSAATRATPAQGATTAGTVTHPGVKDAAAAARSAALAGNRLTWREIGLPVWAYLTAILAAVIAVSGLQSLWAGAGYRRSVTITLWFGFGASLTALWHARPKEAGQSWLNWLSDWSQSHYKLHVVWLVFLAAMAVAGAWALRRDSRTRTWLHAGVVCAFLGTGVTLVGLALLSRFGGVEPMQGAWKYGAIAAGQSSIAWILLMYLNLSPRHDR